jgi:hypothetical protein
VKRAGPIGGSSAGLAILGHYSYTAFDGGSLESKVAFADPLGNRLLRKCSRNAGQAGGGHRRT